MISILPKVYFAAMPHLPGMASNRRLRGFAPAGKFGSGNSHDPLKQSPCPHYTQPGHIASIRNDKTAALYCWRVP
jgi:hypothetical protein